LNPSAHITTYPDASMARAAYSNRVNHDPPITLYRPPTLAECRAAYKSQIPIALVTVDCVAETDNTLYIRSSTGNEYGRQKATFRTFHTLAEAIEATVADFVQERQELQEEAGTIYEIIKYIEDSRGT
jgi:hypothetical protein